MTRLTKGKRIDFCARLTNAAVSMPTGKTAIRIVRSATIKLKSRLCKPHSRVRLAEIKGVVASLKSNKIVVAEGWNEAFVVGQRGQHLRRGTRNVKEKADATFVSTLAERFSERH